MVPVILMDTKRVLESIETVYLLIGWGIGSFATSVMILIGRRLLGA